MPIHSDITFDNIWNRYHFSFHLDVTSSDTNCLNPVIIFIASYVVTSAPSRLRYSIHPLLLTLFYRYCRSNTTGTRNKLHNALTFIINKKEKEKKIEREGEREREREREEGRKYNMRIKQVHLYGIYGSINMHRYAHGNIKIGIHRQRGQTASRISVESFDERCAKSLFTVYEKRRAYICNLQEFATIKLHVLR
jgi:hypothetical protein